MILLSIFAFDNPSAQNFLCFILCTFLYTLPSAVQALPAVQSSEITIHTLFMNVGCYFVNTKMSALSIVHL